MSSSGPNPVLWDMMVRQLCPWELLWNPVPLNGGRDQTPSGPTCPTGRAGRTLGAQLQRGAKAQQGPDGPGLSLAFPPPAHRTGLFHIFRSQFPICKTGKLDFLNYKILFSQGSPLPRLVKADRGSCSDWGPACCFPWLLLGDGGWKGHYREFWNQRP